MSPGGGDAAPPGSGDPGRGADDTLSPDEDGGRPPAERRADTRTGPRRLHPLTVAYQLGSTGVRIGVVALFVGAPGLMAALESGRVEYVASVLLLVLVAVAAVVGYSGLSYRRFEYELTGDTFDIREGVLSRREREIPLRRIQNVDVSQRLPERVLGIAEVRLETAGGGSTEAALRFVGVEEADRLQADISRLRRGAVAGESEAADARAEADAGEHRERLFEISPKELAVLGVVSIDPRVLSILAIGASLFFDSVPKFVEPSVIGGPEQLITRLFGPVASLAVLVLLALGAGVLNATRFYGFRLERDADELRYERGLFQRFSGTIPLSKVQSLTVRENVLARALGYASLTIETAGYAPGSNGGDGSQSAVPLAERERALALARSIEDAGVESLARPPKRARIRYAIRYSLVVAILAGGLALAGRVGLPVPPWYVALLFAPLALLGAHLKWLNLGYALGEDHVVTQDGFWIRKTHVVPYHRVQTVVTRGTVFQRRRDLGTVVVDTAGSSGLFGGDARAIDVDAGTAASLRESIPTSLTAALATRRAEGRGSR